MAYTGNLTPDGLDAKATPIDADVAVVGDSTDSSRAKKTTFAQLRTWIEAFTSYFNVTSDTLDDITTGSTNVHFTATDNTKLDGIEALADVTDNTNVNAAGATMNADTSMAGNGYFLDEDDMTSDDATKVASQQSIKAYVDSAAAIDIQTFTTAGADTWTKPASAKSVEVWCFAAGGGGAGGNSGLDNGEGGAGGGLVFSKFDASGLGSSETLAIGAGGTGGAAGGASGVAGGNSSFGTTLLVALGGQEGTSSTGGTGTGGNGLISQLGGNDGANTATLMSARGGGAGGTSSNGVAGGAFITTLVVAGGTAGVANGGAGGAGVTGSLTKMYGGTGGGGGGGYNGGTGGAGGAGGAYGGGGGGGGGSDGTGGVGGAGADGAIVVITYA